MDFQVAIYYGAGLAGLAGIYFRYVRKSVRKISVDAENTQGPIVTAGGDASVVINSASKKNEYINLTDMQRKVFRILTEVDYVVIYTNSSMCGVGPANRLRHLQGSEAVSAVKELGDLDLATREQETAFGDDASRARTTYRISARGRQYSNGEWDDPGEQFY